MKRFRKSRSPKNISSPIIEKTVSEVHTTSTDVSSVESTPTLGSKGEVVTRTTTSRDEAPLQDVIRIASAEAGELKSLLTSLEGEGDAQASAMSKGVTRTEHVEGAEGGIVRSVVTSADGSETVVRTVTTEYGDSDQVTRTVTVTKMSSDSDLQSFIRTLSVDDADGAESMKSIESGSSEAQLVQTASDESLKHLHLTTHGASKEQTQGASFASSSSVRASKGHQARLEGTSSLQRGVSGSVEVQTPTAASSLKSSVRGGATLFEGTSALLPSVHGSVEHQTQSISPTAASPLKSSVRGGTEHQIQSILSTSSSSHRPSVRAGKEHQTRNVFSAAASSLQPTVRSVSIEGGAPLRSFTRGTSTTNGDKSVRTRASDTKPTKSKSSPPSTTIKSKSERSSLLEREDSKSPGPKQSSYGCIETDPFQKSSSTDSLLRVDDASSSAEGTYLSTDELVKIRVKYFFMNPLERWKASRAIPFSLILQLVKLILVTIQLYVFAKDIYTHQMQFQHATSGLRNIFLIGNDITANSNPAGTYSIYTKPQFYYSANHAVKMYANITGTAIGTYLYTGPFNSMSGIEFCRDEYKIMHDDNTTLIFDGKFTRICHDIPEIYPKNDRQWNKFSLDKYLAYQHDIIEFEKLIKATLSFSLKTIFMETVASINYPECYMLDVVIGYDNTEHDGQMTVSLDSSLERTNCNATLRWISLKISLAHAFRQILNIVIIVICALSLLFCICSIYEAFALYRLVNDHFKTVRNEVLTPQEKLEFLELWDFCIILNDILLIIGSAMRIAVEHRVLAQGNLYATCAVLIGIGDLLVWATLLRYLGFFQKFNILMLTMKRALPNVIRFIICGILLFVGFCFCGWLVLRPYNSKFHSLASSSECLFSILNGNEIYDAFESTVTDNLLIWWFSRIYLYVFTCLYVFVVTSLFIAIVLDSYEVVKQFWMYGGDTSSRIQAMAVSYPTELCIKYYQQERRLKSNINSCMAWFRSRSAVRNVYSRLHSEYQEHE